MRRVLIASRSRSARAVCAPIRQIAASRFLLAQVPSKRPDTPRGREWDNPNLGFEPGLLTDKPFDKHDHPLRPASAYIDDTPPVVVDGRIAACDGGGGQLGHPKVFINLDKSSIEDGVPCGYCGLKFVQLAHVPEGHPLRAHVVKGGGGH